MSFFSGHIESRCRLTKEPDLVNKVWPIDPENELTCGFMSCPHETFCGNPADYGLPANSTEYHSEDLFFGIANFNNFPSSLFSVYSFFMVDGWISITEMYWRAQDKSVSAVFFVSLVLILSQIFSNIILATLYEGFLSQPQIKHGPSDYHEKNKKKSPHHHSHKEVKPNKVQEMTLKEKSKDQFQPSLLVQKNQDQIVQEMKQQAEQKIQFSPSIDYQQSPQDQPLQYDNQICDTEQPFTDQPEYTVYHGRSLFENNFKNENKNTFQKYFIKIKDSPITNLLFFANNLMSIIVLSLDNYSLSQSNYIKLNILDFVVVIILFFEILITFIAQGPKKYFSNNVNILDVLILFAHLISYIVELNQGEDIFNPVKQYFIFIRCTKIMRSFQLLYNYKLFESMTIILNTYYYTLQTIPEYLIVFIVLILVLTQIGRELFAQVIPHDNHELVEEMRINFDTIHDGIIASILIFYNEEWHVSMYQYTSLVGVQSILFYLISMLICQVLFMRLFIAIFINNFMKWLEELEEQHLSSLNYRKLKMIFFKSKQFICKYLCKKNLNSISQIHPITSQQENQDQNNLDQYNQEKNKNLPNSIPQLKQNKSQNLPQSDSSSSSSSSPESQSSELSSSSNSASEKDQRRKSKKQISSGEDLKKQTTFSRSNRVPTLVGICSQKDFKRGFTQKTKNRIDFEETKNNSTHQPIKIQRLSKSRVLQNEDNDEPQENDGKRIRFQSLENIKKEKKKSKLNMFNQTIDEDYFNRLNQNALNLSAQENHPISISESQTPKLSQKISSQQKYKQKINFNLKMQLKKPLNNLNSKKEFLQEDQNEEDLTQKYWAKKQTFASQFTNEDKNNKRTKASENYNASEIDNFILQNNLIQFSDESIKQNQQQLSQTGNDIYQQTQNTEKSIELQKYEQPDNHPKQLFQKQNSDNKEIQQNRNHLQVEFNNEEINQFQSTFISKDYQKNISNQNNNAAVDKQGIDQQDDEAQDQGSPQNSIFDSSKYDVVNFGNSYLSSLNYQQIVESTYFDNIIIASTVVIAAIFVWDSPFLETDGEEKLAIRIIQGILGFFFIVLNALRVFVYGLLFNGYNSYLLRNNYNFLDFITSLTCFIYVFDLNKEALFYLKCINIFRILLLVTYLSKKVSQIQFAGKLVLYCAPRMIRLMIFAIMYLFINGIVTTKLLKGQSWYCVYESEELKSIIVTKNDCLDLGGDWIESLYNFDNIISSIQILYNVQSSEGWLKIMFDTFDSSSNKVPQFQKHSLWAIFYIQFFFIAFICFLNMFVGLVVESYQELLEIDTSTHSLSAQQKEWYFIKKSIYILSPARRMQPPSNKFGKFIFENLIEGNKLQIFFYGFILLNCISFFFYQNRQSRQDIEKLIMINGICLIVFLIELLLKIFVLKSQYFMYKSNIFDIAVLIIGWVNLYQQYNHEVKIFDSYYRIFDGVSKGLQIFRFYWILRHFLVIRKLFKSLHYAISSIKGVLLILIIFLYTSVLLSLNLFPYVKPQETVNNYDIHFRSFFQALFSLIRIVTSEQWFFIPLECAQKQQPNFVCHNQMYSYEDYVEHGLNGCGSQASFFFFYIFYLIFTLVILNIFIATIIESYKQAFNADESAINHYQLDDILKLWTQFDPEGKGYINYKQFWQFSSQIAIIYGVDSKELLDIDNKEKFLKTLDIPIFEDPIHKIFCYKFHDVVIQLSKISVSIKYGVNDLEPEDEQLQTILEKNLKISKMKGENHIKPTKFTSSDMILIILLTRKVREWKKKFVEKEQESGAFSNLKNITMKLQITQNLKKSDYIKENDNDQEEVQINESPKSILAQYN